MSVIPCDQNKGLRAQTERFAERTTVRRGSVNTANF